MSEEIEYKDQEGNPTTLDALCRTEPEWAANRIREGLKTIAELEAEKNGAYTERNQLVAALSKLLPARLERHQKEDEDWEDDWRWIVFIDASAGQMSWHIHDSELPNFDHLNRESGNSWDGHTVEEKYKRLGAIDGDTRARVESHGKEEGR